MARDDDRDASVGADNGCPEWVTGRGHQTKRQRDTDKKVYYTSGADGIVASIDRNARKLDLGHEINSFGMVVMKMYQLRSLMFLENERHSTS